MWLSGAPCKEVRGLSENAVETTAETTPHSTAAPMGPLNRARASAQAHAQDRPRAAATARTTRATPVSWVSADLHASNGSIRPYQKATGDRARKPTSRP